MSKVLKEKLSSQIILTLNSPTEMYLNQQQSQFYFEPMQKIVFDRNFFRRYESKIFG